MSYRGLAILQNQWFKRPDRVRSIYARHPGHRERINRDFLFMGCLTGRRLVAAFGDDIIEQIAFENASPKIGGCSSSRFDGDAGHVDRVICEHRPEFIIAFGSEAQLTVSSLLGYGDGSLWVLAEPDDHREVRSDPGGVNTVHIPVLLAPHPAARGADVMPRLRGVADQVRSILQPQETAP